MIALGPRWLVLPAIVLSGGVCLTLLLTDPTFERARLLDAPAAARGLGAILARTMAGWAGLLLMALLAVGRDGLFRLPRARPALWVALVLLYPIVSVYPQEIVYRTFFFHRYGPLFRRPAVRVAASAVLFGWAHVIVHNAAAVALATVGGALFATTYERSRSTLLASFEHALYGDFLLTVGLGGMFVSGVRLLSKVIP